MAAFSPGASFQSINSRAARYSALGSLAVLAALLAGGCRLTDLPVFGLPDAPPETAFEVERIEGIVYDPGPAADERQHQLDVWRPKGKTGCPVVLLVHGGVWVFGDNRCYGLYSSVGEFLARQGIVAVLPNYRLSPAIKHPGHVRDVARAFAWAHQNIAAHGGRPDHIFLLGHSAGGHLVSLLATDPTYLGEAGLSTSDVKGVISVSGVYRIPATSQVVTLGGAGPRAFWWDELMPPRGSGGWSCTRRLGLSGIPLSVDVFGPAFGKDALTRLEASPLAHVRPGLPPFLLLYAEHDLPALAGMAQEFHRALTSQGCEAGLLRVEERHHNSIIFRAIEPRDPAARVILDFVRRYP